MLEQIKTLPIDIHPVIKSTCANSKFNNKGFADAAKYRIEGFYGFWKASIDSEENQGRTDRLDDKIISKSLTNTIEAIGSSTVKDNRGAKSSVDTFNIFDELIAETIEERVKYFEEALRVSLGTLGLKTESEKDQFISKHLLQEPIDKAYEIINEIFGIIETSVELYLDPEEPDIKFLNITVAPNNVSEGGIDPLLDKFDKLQENFFNIIDQKFASKITFHIEIV